jgi:hypothetical protein
MDDPVDPPAEDRELSPEELEAARRRFKEAMRKDARWLSRQRAGASREATPDGDPDVQVQYWDGHRYHRIGPVGRRFYRRYLVVALLVVALLFAFLYWVVFVFAPAEVDQVVGPETLLPLGPRHHQELGPWTLGRAPGARHAPPGR